MSAPKPGGFNDANLADADVRAHLTERQPTADHTHPPGVREYPAMMTHMAPGEFKAWLEAPGRLFLVYLPAGKAFPIKVPDEQYQFFVAMLTQLRIHLGPEVQAQSAQPVAAPANQPPPAPAAPPPDFGINLAPPAPPGHRRSCPGSGHEPIGSTVRGREYAPNGVLRCPGRACCKTCGRELKLTNAGTIRLHRDRTNEED